MLIRNNLKRRIRFTNYRKSCLSTLLEIDPIVQDALTHNRPVVALESTIVAHGMPYPENLNLSKKVASILREHGVEPATIAVKDGVCRVGLSADELAELAQAGSQAQKCTTRQLPLLIGNSNSGWGATTVASTMALAHRAGIATFVTGGIGGVHRDGHLSMDVSADLLELSRTPVIVVSAGIKSILDIPRTLEVLETNGVPVLAYQTDEFPAFFSPHSGVKAPARVESALEIARAYQAGQQLGLPNGMLVAVPNQDPASGAAVEEAIQSALSDSTEQGIVGPAVTPFVLKHVAEKTGGESLRSNVALVEQNAMVGAEIAVEVTRQREPRVFLSSSNPESKPRVVVLGGSVVDIVAKPKGDLLLATSNPASCTESDGGVGRNVAEALGRLGSSPRLYSAVGKDARGQSLLHRLKEECNVDTCILAVEGYNTATYLAVLEQDGDLHAACADMDVLDQIPALSSQDLEGVEIIVLDANPPPRVLRDSAVAAHTLGAKVLWEPTSVPKALPVAQDEVFMACLSYATPNVDELSAMARNTTHTIGITEQGITEGELEEVRDCAFHVLARMNPIEAHLVVTLGSNGVVLASRTKSQSAVFQHFPARKDIGVHNATGAGDSLTGAFVHALLQGMAAEEAVLFGIEAATRSLQCLDRAVSPNLQHLSMSI